MSFSTIIYLISLLFSCSGAAITVTNSFTQMLGNKTIFSDALIYVCLAISAFLVVTGLIFDRRSAS